MDLGQQSKRSRLTPPSFLSEKTLRDHLEHGPDTVCPAGQGCAVEDLTSQDYSAVGVVSVGSIFVETVEDSFRAVRCDLIDCPEVASAERRCAVEVAQFVKNHTGLRIVSLRPHEAEAVEDGLGS